MKKGIAVVIGVAMVLIVSGVAFGLSTYLDIETELTNTEPEPEVTPESAEAPAGKNLKIDLSESIGVGGQ